WVFFILVAIITIQEVRVPASAILWIFASAFLVYIGSLIGLGRGLYKATPNIYRENIANNQSYEPRALRLPWLVQLTIICSLLGFLSVIIFVLSRGYGLSVFTSIRALSEMGNEVLSMRYGESGYAEPAFVMYFYTINYVGAMLGGILFSSQKAIRYRIVALLPILMISLLGLALVGRTIILVAVVLWLASNFTTRVYLRKGFASIPVRLVIISTLCILAIAVVTQYLRYNLINLGSESINELLSRSHDTFAYLPAFGQWFVGHWQDSTPLTLGASSFARIYARIGIADVFVYDEVTVGNTKTNIFTIFRELIDDFSPLGSMIWLFVIGIIAGFTFRQISKGKIHFFPILLGFYAYVLFSQTRTIFYYTSVLIALIIFTAYLLIPNRRKLKF
ncbi:O-antigen polymerase, partial [Chloroflexota bacterium]